MQRIVIVGVVSICMVSRSKDRSYEEPVAKAGLIALLGAPYQWAAILPKDALHIKTGYDDLHFYSAQHKK